MNMMQCTTHYRLANLGHEGSQGGVERWRNAHADHGRRAVRLKLATSETSRATGQRVQHVAHLLLHRSARGRKRKKCVHDGYLSTRLMGCER